jgi:hypothetical protein
MPQIPANPRAYIPETISDAEQRLLYELRSESRAFLEALQFAEETLALPTPDLLQILADVVAEIDAEMHVSRLRRPAPVS